MDYQLFKSASPGILTFIMGEFIFILLILAGLVLGLLGHQAGLRVAQVLEQTLKSMND